MDDTSDSTSGGVIGYSMILQWLLSTVNMEHLLTSVILQPTENLLWCDTLLNDNTMSSWMIVNIIVISWLYNYSMCLTWLETFKWICWLIWMLVLLGDLLLQNSFHFHFLRTFPPGSNSLPIEKLKNNLQVDNTNIDYNINQLCSL